MTIIEAIILGLIQGLTEFLPVSSSGHIELGKVLFNVETADNLTFSIVVHGATVLSIIVIFYKDLWQLIAGVFKFSWNEETKYTATIALSMIPVGIIGVFFEDQIEQLFSGRVLFVGFMLLVTALILFLTKYGSNEKKDIGFRQAFIIGIAQAIAIIPGISRSGFTIGTALLLGIDKEKATRFSFIMVLVPILGATVLKAKDLMGSSEAMQTEMAPLIAGFIGAFFSGLLACKWMLSLVKKGKIIYFSIYCLLLGLIAIISTMI